MKEIYRFLAHLFYISPQLATAWVNFEGDNCTGGVGNNECLIGVGGSYNISSVIKISNGKYTINFQNVMNYTNYVVSGITHEYQVTASNVLNVIQGTENTNSVDIVNLYHNNGNDETFRDKKISVLILGGKN